MERPSLQKISKLINELIPADGTSMGNVALRKALSESLGVEISESEYFVAQQALVDDGLLVRGRGRGGSVSRVVSAEIGLTLSAQEIPAAAKLRKPQQTGMTLAQAKQAKASPKLGKKADEDTKVIAYRHDQSRKNNPDVGVVTPDNDPEHPKTAWAYDPHIDPALQFDVKRAQLEKLIDDALASGDEATMRATLEQLKRQAEPYLNWTGKAERTSFEVDTVSLHVHERIDPASILAVVQKRMQDSKGKDGSQADMFRAWFEEPLPLREAVDFYKHDRGWSNRLVAGDSLLVMNSLLQKEGMAGQVQMIYIDPPYGIKYGSNFQPFVNKRDVKDRKDEDLTQEPEMIKAFRDTWELGIHSYLTYLRDRLLLAKELLHESGSVFVQISDENLHLVRNLMEEVFGQSNYCGTIKFRRGGFQTTELLPETNDFVVWFAKKIDRVKYHPLYKSASRETAFTGQQIFGELASGANIRISREEVNDENYVKIFRHRAAYSASGSQASRFSVSYQGQEFLPSGERGWSTNDLGMRRAGIAKRLFPVGKTLERKMFFEDFPVEFFSSTWDDTISSGFSSDKIYVVQTQEIVVQRILLMTSDPGDLVLDPTCGSGTTAFVAEKWGRRWVTCDTSRVAVTLAKQRLMTASYDYYDLKYPHEGLKAGFIYRTVPHVTLKSIANNQEIDEINEKMYPAIEAALDELNKALKTAGTPFMVGDGGRKGKVIEFDSTEKHTLPTGEQVPANALLEWEVPFDFPAGWQPSARTAFDSFHAARQAMQKKMDDSIAAHADQEVLYDQPQVSRNKLRITGPFTVEAVPFASVQALDEARSSEEADASIARSGESMRQHSWRDELLKTGIRGKGGQMLKFVDLETLPDTRYLHCTGYVEDGSKAGDGEAAPERIRVVVSFGPEHATLEQRQVELAMREAGDLFPRPKMIAFCAFAFDPEAAKDIDATKGITALKVQMNTDLLTEDLKKARSNNQSFWLMGQPDVEVRKDKDGKYVVEVHGFDYFDTVSGELKSGGKKNIAAWSLDTDYDERSLFPSQVFFPMAGSKDGWYKLKKDIKAELDETRLDRLHGTISLPFVAGHNRKIAVKIVDDRGIESLKVVALD